VGLWDNLNMTHMQKSFISFVFAGSWFGPNLTEVEIELAMCGIGRRAVLWSVVRPKFDTCKKVLDILVLWSCGLVPI
jgi:hypothetical protein